MIKKCVNKECLEFRYHWEKCVSKCKDNTTHMHSGQCNMCWGWQARRLESMSRMGQY